MPTELELIQIRLQAAMHQISELLLACNVPSISIGVLHSGQVIQRQCFCLRDVEQNFPANCDTLYLISSLSQGFLSAMVGKAVADSKMDWSTPLGQIIPELKPNDQEIRQKASIKDFLRYSTGFCSPQPADTRPSRHADQL